MRRLAALLCALAAGGPLAAVANASHPSPATFAQACDKTAADDPLTTHDNDLSTVTLSVPSVAGVSIRARFLLPANAKNETVVNGTPIPGTAHRVPVVIATHTLGSSLQSPLNALAYLVENHGYALLVWDTRGHGGSTPAAGGVGWSFGAPAYEVEDAKRLLALLASCRILVQDGAGDPRVGWWGKSNGAGIQLNTAAATSVVDAIMPYEPWGDLERELTPEGIPTENADRIYDPSRPVVYDDAFVQFAGEIDPPTRAASTSSQLWLRERSTVRYRASIASRSLLVGSTGDTLLGANGLIEHYESMESRGVPARLILDCGQHGGIAIPTYPLVVDGIVPGTKLIRETPVCNQTSSGSVSQSLQNAEFLRLIDGYLKDDATRRAEYDGRPRVIVQVDRNGSPKYLTLNDLPAPVAFPIAAGVTLAGPGGTGGDEVNGNYGGPASPAELQGGTGVRLPVIARAAQTTCFAGTPQLTLRGRAVGAAGATLFVELVDSDPAVDPSLGTRSLHYQVTPKRLPSGEFEATFPLAAVGYRLLRDHALSLEITTGSTMFREAEEAFSVRIDDATLELPTVTPDLYWSQAAADNKC